jgi:hypothetical protein
MQARITKGRFAISLVVILFKLDGNALSRRRLVRAARRGLRTDPFNWGRQIFAAEFAADGRADRNRGRRG